MDQENVFPQDEHSSEEARLRKENKIMKIALLSIAGVLLTALAVVLFLVVYNGIKDDGKIVATEPAVVFTPSDYTVSDEEAIAASSTVVAVVGDKKLTNGELNAYYWMQVYDFFTNYGSYYNVDLAKPLGEQRYSESQSWEELFLELALNSWNRYAILQIMGEKAGYVLADDIMQKYNELPESLAELAKELNFETVEAMIAQEMGAGCTMDGYMKYMYTSYYCNDYFAELYETLKPTDAEIAAYYEENKDTFVNAGITKEMGKAVDVRHILLIPEGGTATEGSNYMTYTDEAWEACRVKAQGILDAYLAGESTESAFATLASHHSADGSASNGGLITNILQGKTVANFNDWIFDETRQKGDYGLVRTEYGYHIMYFLEAEEYWVRSARTNMVGETATKLIDEAMEATPMDVNLEMVALSQADLLS